MRPFVKGFASELVKLGFHEGWGMSGEWGSGAESPIPDNSTPILAEQSVPADVDLKTERANHFATRFQPSEEGKIEAGKLGVIGRKRVS